MRLRRRRGHPLAGPFDDALIGWLAGVYGRPGFVVLRFDGALFLVR